jgi:hypothetical protein
MSFLFHSESISSWISFSNRFYIIKINRGGELFKHLSEVRRFDEERTRFYAA